MLRMPRRLFLFVAIFPLVVLYLALAAYVALDPFGMRQGQPPLLNSELYPDDVRPRLLKAVAKGDYNLLLIGGSTMMGVQQSLLKKVFGDTVRSFNFSYKIPMPQDFRYVLDEVVAQSKQLQRAVVAVDFTLLRSENQVSPSFPLRIYASSWFDPLLWNAFLRTFDGYAVEATARRLFSRDLRFSWQDTNDVPEYMTAGTIVRWNASPASISSLKNSVERFRDSVEYGSGVGCSQLSSVTDSLRSFAIKASQRNIQVDILFPPYATAVYYQWLAINPFNMLEHREGVLDQILTLRRCLVHELTTFPNVKLYAFDNEDWITSDLHNYFDTSHLSNQSVLSYVFESIANGSHTLTPANFSDYENTLRSRIRHFTPDMIRP
jgi:hypothetical protein